MWGGKGGGDRGRGGLGYEILSGMVIALGEPPIANQALVGRVACARRINGNTSRSSSGNYVNISMSNNSSSGSGNGCNSGMSMRMSMKTMMMNITATFTALLMVTPSRPMSYNSQHKTDHAS